jgi:hypothetical protein
MYQERKPNIGEVPAANPDGGHHFRAIPSAQPDPGVGLRRLEWIGPNAFEARYGAQQRWNRDVGMSWGPRQGQRVFDRCAIQNTQRGLFYAYHLTCDECAIFATDVSVAVDEAVLSRALASDRYMSAEEFVGLMTDHLAALTPDGTATADLATGINR